MWSVIMIFPCLNKNVSFLHSERTRHQQRGRVPYDQRRWGAMPPCCRRETPLLEVLPSIAIREIWNFQCWRRFLLRYKGLTNSIIHMFILPLNVNISMSFFLFTGEGDCQTTGVQTGPGHRRENRRWSVGWWPEVPPSPQSHQTWSVTSIDTELASDRQSHRIWILR